MDTSSAACSTHAERVRPPSHPIIWEQSPNAEWQPGDVQPPNPADGWGSGHISLDPSRLVSNYPLLISSIVPRPIALVSSISPDGAHNLAPFSYFSAVGHDPPTIAFSVCANPGTNAVPSSSSTSSNAGVGPGSREKDTLFNVTQTGECVVHIISENYLEAANYTSGAFPHGVDEAAVSGLTRGPCDVVKPSRILEAGVAMECLLRGRHEVRRRSASGAEEGPVTTTMLICEIVRFHIAEGLLSDLDADKVGDGLSMGENGGDAKEWRRPVVDAVRLHPVCRLGDVTYGLLGTLCRIPRPPSDAYEARRHVPGCYQSHAPQK